MKIKFVNLLWIILMVGFLAVGNVAFGQTQPGAAGSGWNLESITTGYGLPQGSVLGIIENILFWLLSVMGLMGVIGFLISGILYLTSTGDEDMIERAKHAMTWSIVGVIVGLAGVVIIQAVNVMLSGWGTF